MKNIDKIRQMNSDELAKLMDTRCKCCIYEICYKGADCELGIREWLEQEVDE